MWQRGLTALACFLVGFSLGGVDRARGAEPMTLAVLDFDTAGTPALGPDGGVMLAELLSVALGAHDGLRLVERAALRRALDEQALGLSGMVDGATAARVRRLVGCQALVTGRVFAMSSRLVVTTRIIGTETGHLETVVTEGRPGDDPRVLAAAMADRIARLLAARGSAFAASQTSAAGPAPELAKGVAGMALPRVALRVRETVLNIEDQHSAAANELTTVLLAANFDVRQVSDAALPVELDEYLRKPAAPDGIDVIVLGRAVGQFGLRTGDLVSAKARVKLTAVDTRTQRVLATAEMEAREIDVAARDAALHAISTATREIARVFVPKLVLAWNRKAK